MVKTKNCLHHDRSSKLEDFENDRLIKHIDKDNCVTLSTAVIQLFFSKCSKYQDISEQEWSKFSCGVVCLIKDFNTNNFYFRLFDLNPNILWEEPLTETLSYTKISSHFYYYYGLFNQKRTTGFNFAYEDEAEKFFNTTSSVLNTLTKQMNKVAPSSTGLNSISFNMPSFDDKNKYFLTEKKPVEKKLIKKKIISKPIGNTFVHVNHIGYSGNNIFNVKMNDQNDHFKMILDLLKEVNIKPNKQTLEYADKYIQSNGGYNKYFNSYKEYKKNRTRSGLSSDLKINKNIENTPISCNSDRSDIPGSNEAPFKPRPPPKPPAYQPKENKTQMDASNQPPTLPRQEASNQESKPIERSPKQTKSEFLSSIENFKGKLRHVEPNIYSDNSNDMQSDNIMSQLFKALSEMRQYLNNSSDESSEDSSDETFGKEA